MQIGILGLGGLGQMGIKLAKEMGNTVVAISSSARKEKEAYIMGADRYVKRNSEN